MLLQHYTALPHTFKNAGRNQKSEKDSYSSPPMRTKSCSLRFHFFEAHKDDIRGKRFGRDKVIEEVAASTELEQVEEGDRRYSFSLTQGC
jgi:hypothetical protein